MPVALPRHDTIGGECTMKHAVEVDVQHAAPLVWGQIARIAADCDAGVVEHVIDASIFRGHGLGEMDDGVFACHVEMDGACLRTGLYDARGQALGRVSLDIRDDDNSGSA